MLYVSPRTLLLPLFLETFPLQNFYFVPTFTESYLFSSEDSIERTSISPIPRPVSSVNMATLASQSSFPVCLTPPPTPSTPSVAAAQQVEAQSEEVESVSVALKRALSCDSVCSDTSVALGDLEEVNITGYLCIGLEYER